MKNYKIPYPLRFIFKFFMQQITTNFDYFLSNAIFLFLTEVVGDVYLQKVLLIQGVDFIHSLGKCSVLQIIATSSCNMPISATPPYFRISPGKLSDMAGCATKGYVAVAVIFSKKLGLVVRWRSKFTIEQLIVALSLLFCQYSSISVLV